MKWLTLDEIKQQLRIEPDFTDEDALLTSYGTAAEDTVLNVCSRTYDDFIDNYGEIPQAVKNATLLLVSTSYEQRGAVNMQQLYAVPYAFDMLVKPYMRLSSNSDAAPVQVVTLGSDVKIAFTVDLPDDLKLSDIDFSGKVMNSMDSTKVLNFVKADCIMIEDGTAYVVMVDSDMLGIGSYLLQVTVLIPDSDYTSGYRKEVVKINPHISVKG
jgi:uncharacterized phage protein (predicted DNA packaging)